MAKTIPQVPNLDVREQGAISRLVYVGIITGVIPSGTNYPNIFGLGCILIAADTGMIWTMDGTVLSPSWASLPTATQNVVLNAPGLKLAGSAYNVGNAANFAILSGTHLTYTNTGDAIITTGNTGETTLTGAPASFGSGSDTGTASPYAAAITDVAALHTRLIGLSGTDITPWATDISLHGQFTPGIYTTASAIGVAASKTIVLSGAGDYVFISTGGAITFGATDTIVLTNGATADRIFWVANNAITTGATNTLSGNFMPGAAGAITIGSTNIINGRLLGPVAVTLDGTATTLALPTGGASSTLISSSNTFGVRVNNILGVPIAPTNMPSLATALLPNGTTVGNLAFDNGSVPDTTKSCQMFTFLSDVNPTTGATTLSVVAGFAFPKDRPVNISTDVYLGTGKAVIGFLYVKNESSAVFVPGTTPLNTVGITALANDAFGYPLVGSPVA